MYLCIHVYTHIWVNVFIYIWIYLCMCIQMYKSIYMCIIIYIFIYLYIYIHIVCIFIYTYSYICLYIFWYIMRIYTFNYMNAYMDWYIYIFICIIVSVHLCDTFLHICSNRPHLPSPLYPHRLSPYPPTPPLPPPTNTCRKLRKALGRVAMAVIPGFGKFKINFSFVVRFCGSVLLGQFCYGVATVSRIDKM